MEQQALQYATINGRQRLQIGDRNALVDLVDRRVDPPVHETSGVMPQFSPIASATAATSLPRRVR